MSVYGFRGNALDHIYGVDGEELKNAYDVDGNLIYDGDVSKSIKVMQYNCGQWYDGGHDNVPASKDAEYYDLQTKMIDDANPDILALEEYTAQFSKAGRTALSFLSQRFTYYHEQTDGTTTTVTQRAIFSKYPISDYVTHRFQDADNNTYYYDTCTIMVGDTPVHFIITHLHWNNRTYRNNESALILADANNYETVIICGDMNTVDCYNTSGADYNAVLKKFVDDGYHLANGGDFGFIYTLENSGTEYCLDNIITSSNILIESVYADRTKINDEITDATDHLPLIATLQIN